MATPQGIKVTVRVDKLHRLQASIQQKAVDEVRTSAHYMQGYASSIAPRDTGAFSESLYVNGPLNESDYQQRAGRARALRPTATIIPELVAAQTIPNMNVLRSNLGQFARPEALVGSAVDYSVHLEYGTRYMGPRPTFFPAALATRTKFESAMRKVAD
jgi:hypothetical protein